MLAEGKTGIIITQDGAQNVLRQDKTGALITSDGHGRYTETVRRGNCYYATSPGAALGTALTATAVTLTLYNPQNSTSYLSLLNCTVGITTAPTSGTTAYVLAANVNPLGAVPATNTTATNFGNALLGATPARGVGIAYTATTLPAAPITVWSMGQYVFVGVATAVTGFNLISQIDGQIVLAPNTAITLQGIGVATTGTVTMMWEEIAI